MGGRTEAGGLIRFCILMVNSTSLGFPQAVLENEGVRPVRIIRVNNQATRVAEAMWWGHRLKKHQARRQEHKRLRQWASRVSVPGHLLLRV